MRRVILAIAALSLLALSGTIFAQDWSAEPLYGTYTLATGFTPDPQSVDIMAGGANDASTLGMVDPTGGMCLGNINAAAPDVRLNYTAGTAFPIQFYVVSTADTTLAINMPDATWRCNDDGATPGAGLNPVITVQNPPSGQYDIWVGTYSPGTPQAATLYVTELADTYHPANPGQ